VEDFADLGDHSPQIILPSLRTLTNEAERTFDSPRQRSNQGAQKPLVVSGVVVVPFEEEEEWIGIAINIVKVKGEDPATHGCPREDRVRRSVGDSTSGVRSIMPREETPGL